MKCTELKKTERKVSGLIRDKRMNEVQVTAEYKSEWDTSNVSPKLNNFKTQKIFKKKYKNFRFFFSILLFLRIVGLVREELFTLVLPIRLEHTKINSNATSSPTICIYPDITAQQLARYTPSSKLSLINLKYREIGRKRLIFSAIATIKS